METGSIDGARVLVVEDDILIALELAENLAQGGAIVEGPYHTLGDAMDAARATGIDLALLDIDLEGEEVFPVARILRKRGVPFMFHTGHADREILRTDFRDVPVANKPAEARRLLARLGALRHLAA
ncbi:response regulator [Pelagibacterium xiamenense]|uniref:response regulator n=1 Tax=Pelagibacterium xiamenense TaxID=2901140 RepID=UPI001E33CD9E|nr:response regulator [Pelagibacterium xiamenense]MCD7059166.1 response regulator [Pelagibacterium xiamenense]